MAKLQDIIQSIISESFNNPTSRQGEQGTNNEEESQQELTEQHMNIVREYSEKINLDLSKNIERDEEETIKNTFSSSFDSEDTTSEEENQPFFDLSEEEDSKKSLTSSKKSSNNKKGLTNGQLRQWLDSINEILEPTPLPIRQKRENTLRYESMPTPKIGKTSSLNIVTNIKSNEQINNTTRTLLGGSGDKEQSKNRNQLEEGLAEKDLKESREMIVAHFASLNKINSEIKSLRNQSEFLKKEYIETSLKSHNLDRDNLKETFQNFIQKRELGEMPIVAQAEFNLLAAIYFAQFDDRSQAIRYLLAAQTLVESNPDDKDNIQSVFTKLFEDKEIFNEKVAYNFLIKAIRTKDAEPLWGLFDQYPTLFYSPQIVSDVSKQFGLNGEQYDTEKTIEAFRKKDESFDVKAYISGILHLSRKDEFKGSIQPETISNLLDYAMTYAMTHEDSSIVSTVARAVAPSISQLNKILLEHLKRICLKHPLDQEMTNYSNFYVGKLCEEQDLDSLQTLLSELENAEGMDKIQAQRLKRIILSQILNNLLEKEENIDLLKKEILSSIFILPTPGLMALGVSLPKVAKYVCDNIDKINAIEISSKESRPLPSLLNYLNKFLGERRKTHDLYNSKGERTRTLFEETILLSDKDREYVEEICKQQDIITLRIWFEQSIFGAKSSERILAGIIADQIFATSISELGWICEVYAEQGVSFPVELIEKIVSLDNIQDALLKERDNFVINYLLEDVEAKILEEEKKQEGKNSVFALVGESINATEQMKKLIMLQDELIKEQNAREKLRRKSLEEMPYEHASILKPQKPELYQMNFVQAAEHALTNMVKHSDMEWTDLELYLISVENKGLEDTILKQARDSNTPILIKKGKGNFSVYGYQDNEWKESPLSLSDIEKMVVNDLYGKLYREGVVRLKNEELNSELREILKKGHTHTGKDEVTQTVIDIIKELEKNHDKNQDNLSERIREVMGSQYTEYENKKNVIKDEMISKIPVEKKTKKKRKKVIKFLPSGQGQSLSSVDTKNSEIESSQTVQPVSQVEESKLNNEIAPSPEIVSREKKVNKKQELLSKARETVDDLKKNLREYVKEQIISEFFDENTKPVSKNFDTFIQEAIKKKAAQEQELRDVENKLQGLTKEMSDFSKKINEDIIRYFNLLDQGKDDHQKIRIKYYFSSTLPTLIRDEYSKYETKMNEILNTAKELKQHKKNELHIQVSQQLKDFKAQPSLQNIIRNKFFKDDESKSDISDDISKFIKTTIDIKEQQEEQQELEKKDIRNQLSALGEKAKLEMETITDSVISLLKSGSQNILQGEGEINEEFYTKETLNFVENACQNYNDEKNLILSNIKKLNSVQKKELEEEGNQEIAQSKNALHLHIKKKLVNQFFNKIDQEERPDIYGDFDKFIAQVVCENSSNIITHEMRLNLDKIAGEVIAILAVLKVNNQEGDDSKTKIIRLINDELRKYHKIRIWVEKRSNLLSTQKDVPEENELFSAIYQKIMDNFGVPDEFKEEGVNKGNIARFIDQVILERKNQLQNDENEKIKKGIADEKEKLKKAGKDYANILAESLQNIGMHGPIIKEGLNQNIELLTQAQLTLIRTILEGQALHCDYHNDQQKESIFNEALNEEFETIFLLQKTNIKESIEAYLEEMGKLQQSAQTFVDQLTAQLNPSGLQKSNQTLVQAQGALEVTFNEYMKERDKLAGWRQESFDQLVTKKIKDSQLPSNVKEKWKEATSVERGQGIKTYVAQMYQKEERQSLVKELGDYLNDIVEKYVSKKIPETEQKSKAMYQLLGDVSKLSKAIKIIDNDQYSDAQKVKVFQELGMNGIINNEILDQILNRDDLNEKAKFAEIKEVFDLDKIIEDYFKAAWIIGMQKQRGTPGLFVSDRTGAAVFMAKYLDEKHLDEKGNERFPELRKLAGSYGGDTREDEHNPRWYQKTVLKLLAPENENALNIARTLLHKTEGQKLTIESHVFKMKSHQRTEETGDISEIFKWRK